MSQSVEFQKKADAMKVAKEELKKSRELKQKERFVSSKEEYEKAVEDFGEEEVVAPAKKDKKIKKRLSNMWRHLVVKVKKKR